MWREMVVRTAHTDLTGSEDSRVRRDGFYKPDGSFHKNQSTKNHQRSS